MWDFKLYELHKNSTHETTPCCLATLIKAYHPLLDVSPFSIQTIIFLQTEKGKKQNLDEKGKHRTFRHALPGFGRVTQLHTHKHAGKSCAECHQTSLQHVPRKSRPVRGKGCLGYSQGTRQLLCQQCRITVLGGLEQGA